MNDKINVLRPMKYYSHKSVNGLENGFFATELTNDDIEIIENFDGKEALEKIFFNEIVKLTKD